MLILDEADRMLGDEILKPDLVTILDALPTDRQTLMFSATKISKVDKIVSKEKLLGERLTFITIDTTIDFAKTVAGL